MCKLLCSASIALLLLNSVFSAEVFRISNVFSISASYNFRVTLLHCTKLLCCTVPSYCTPLVKTAWGILRLPAEALVH
jgi:hypothetical protein